MSNRRGKGRKRYQPKNRPAQNNVNKSNTVEIDENGHATESIWTFWYGKKPKGGASYSSSVKKLASFGTVEKFYQIYSHLNRPLNMQNNSSLMLFRGVDDNPPKWENWTNGGCWIIDLQKRNPHLNVLWEKTLFACIGETFEDPSVVGVYLKTRPKVDTIMVWNTDRQKSDFLGEKIVEILNLGNNFSMDYVPHASQIELQVRNKQHQEAAKKRRNSKLESQKKGYRKKASNEKVADAVIVINAPEEDTEPAETVSEVTNEEPVPVVDANQETNTPENAES
eukprot:TRINITY_DN4678_c0_g2_i1.p1 TRINITY_DN4678_c0_g2~~TRINITY_DN4678_c0_g2_i1.p1  ORF type:complete len:281 (+),score=79.77 TRINITY_DN4678_c0_g2_i1:64-906(+)